MSAGASDVERFIDILARSRNVSAIGAGREPYDMVGPPALIDYSYTQSPARQIDTLAAVRRHWRLILGLAVAACVAAFLFCRTLTPLYAAKTTVMIDPRESKQPALSADPTSAQSPSEEAVRKNQIALIRSRSLAASVVSDLHLDSDPEFNPTLRPPSSLRNAVDGVNRLFSGVAAAVGLGGSAPDKSRPVTSKRDKAIDVFLDRLSTTSTDASRVIEIRFSSENPERAARVANAIADRYTEYKVKQDYAEAQSAIGAFRKEIDTLNSNIRESERTIEKLRDENGLLPTSHQRVAGEQITEMFKELTAASSQRAAAEGRLADLQAARASNRLASASSVLGSPLIQHLDGQAAELAAKVAEMSTLYGAQHPKMVQARAQLKDLRAQINAEIAKVATTYQSDVAIAQAKEASLRKMLRSVRADSAKSAVSEADVRAIEREAEGNRNLMGLLVARLNDTEAQINRKGPEVRLLSNATVPESPSYPPKLAVVAAAFLFAMTGGTLLAVLLERRDQSIRSVLQLRHLTPTRVLGTLPAVKRSRPFRQSPIGMVLAEPTSMFAENLRAVWFQVNHSMQHGAKMLVIASAVSGEGKTSIAISLARLLALSGRRIVIVDADLRHPSVHRKLGLNQSPGLADLLEGSVNINEVLQQDAPSGAFFVAAGAVIGSPADALQSANTSEIIRHLSASFDAVIVDTPPLLAVQDAGMIAQYADMMLMVVRWGATRETAVLAALRQLHDLKIPVTGMVLSMVDQKEYGKYGYPVSGDFSDSVRSYHSS